MYNEELKLSYLKEMNDLTKHQYILFFEKISPIETQLEKDLSNFSLEEMETALLFSKPKNNASLKARCSMMNGYYKWANSTEKLMFRNLTDEYCKRFVVEES